MRFRKTFKIFETGYQRNIYYYIDNKRVSSEKYYETQIACQRMGMKYNSSVLYTNYKNGRIVMGCCYD